MPNYECSTCDYCDKNRKQGNKVRCIRFSKFVEGLSICEEFTNKEYEEAMQKVNRMVERACQKAIDKKDKAVLKEHCSHCGARMDEEQ